MSNDVPRKQVCKVKQADTCICTLIDMNLWGKEDRVTKQVASWRMGANGVRNCEGTILEKYA